MKTSSIFSKAMFIVIMFFSTAAVNAQNNYESKDKGVVIKHIGNVNDNMLFQVQIDNDKEEKLNLTINEKSGNNLYREFINKKKYEKTFQVPKELKNDLVFYVRNAKDNRSEAYEIQTDIVSIEKTTIKRVE